jgi:hypothetical protein
MATGYLAVDSMRVNLSEDQYSTKAKFLAMLWKPIPGPDCYKLTIYLRVRLKQAFPGPLVKDYNGTPFWIRPWSGSEWSTFVNGAKAAAKMWNNQFWLKAPQGMKDYDMPRMQNYIRSSWRPYIACELDVDFSANQGDADMAIDVYNLQLSTINGTANAGTFRSDSLHWDSLDATPWLAGYVDETGAPVQQNCIAHEIGHAIGLKHIGVLTKSPTCQMAMNLKDMGLDKYDPNSKGGDASFYCYGIDRPSIGKNIMGGGNAFSEENARPWLWALALLRQKYGEPWQVLRGAGAGGETVVHVGLDR